AHRHVDAPRRSGVCAFTSLHPSLEETGLDHRTNRRGDLCALSGAELSARRRRNRYGCETGRRLPVTASASWTHTADHESAEPEREARLDLVTHVVVAARHTWSERALSKD